MYDHLHIDKKHLPSHLKDKQTGWQTKSLDCLMDTLIISEAGKLLIITVVMGKGEIIEETNYTGEIRFYQKIDDIWTVFVAFFENGQMFKLIQI